MSNQIAPVSTKDLVMSDRVLSAFRGSSRVAGVDAEKIQMIVVTQLHKSADLAKCDPNSVVAAAMQGLQLGLLPDGIHGHLMPFKDGKATRAGGKDVYRAQFVADYKGLIQLAYRSGMVEYIDARPVYRQEVESGSFSLDFGRNPQLIHGVLMAGSPGDEDFVGVYAIARIKGGTMPIIEWMNRDQLLAHKRKYVRRESDLMTFAQWASKTAIRKIIKRLPISAEYQHAIIAGDDDTPETQPAAAFGEFIDAEVIETAAVETHNGETT